MRHPFKLLPNQLLEASLGEGEDRGRGDRGDEGDIRGGMYGNGEGGLWEVAVGEGAVVGGEYTKTVVT